MRHPPPMRLSRRTASPLEPASPAGVWKVLPFLLGGSDDSPQAPCCPYGTHCGRCFESELCRSLVAALGVNPP